MTKLFFGGEETDKRKIYHFVFLLFFLVGSQGIVLTAIPFISAETKAKALASLRGFAADDVTKVGVSVKSSPVLFRIKL